MLPLYSYLYLLGSQRIKQRLKAVFIMYCSSSTSSFLPPSFLFFSLPFGQAFLPVVTSLNFIMRKLKVDWKTQQYGSLGKGIRH